MNTRVKAPGEGIMTKVDSVYAKLSEVEDLATEVRREQMSPSELRSGLKDIGRSINQVKEVLKEIPTEHVDLSTINRRLEEIQDKLDKIDLERIMKLLHQIEERIPNLEPFFAKIEECHSTILALSNKLGIKL